MLTILFRLHPQQTQKGRCCCFYSIGEGGELGHELTQEEKQYPAKHLLLRNASTLIITQGLGNKGMVWAVPDPLRVSLWSSDKVLVIYLGCQNKNPKE